MSDKSFPDISKLKKAAIETADGAAGSIADRLHPAKRDRVRMDEYTAFQNLRHEAHRAEKERIQADFSNLMQRYDVLLYEVQSLHKSCDIAIDWNRIANVPAPFGAGMVGPEEQAALELIDRHIEATNQLPSDGVIGNIIDKIAGIRREKLNKIAISARERDDETYAEWEHYKTLADAVLAGNTDTYTAFLEELNPLEVLSMYTSSADIKVLSQYVAEADLGAEQEYVVPDFSLFLKKDGRVQVKPLNPLQRNELMLNHVCSCAIRAAREIFAVLPFHTIYVNVNNDYIDTSTGMPCTTTLLSVRFERSAMENLNFERIIPSECMRNFRHHIKYTAVTGMLPIAPLRKG